MSFVQFLFFMLIVLLVANDSGSDAYVYFMQTDMSQKCVYDKSLGGQTMRTYCYDQVTKRPHRFFQTIEMIFDIESEGFTQYEGATPLEVLKHYNERQSLFSFTLFSQKQKRLEFSPFENKCIGMDTRQTYTVRIKRIHVDLSRVAQFTLGLIIFFNAGLLSQNSAFYYLSGIIMGICSSFMLLIWFTSKLFPRRPMMYGVLLGGWAIGVYMLQLLVDNIRIIFVTYRNYVLWYIFITGFLSFLICYRIGPPTNHRSKNIIKWILQLSASILIYFSSYLEPAIAGIVIAIVFIYYFPLPLWRKLRIFINRRFPRRRRLLTKEEFRQQGIEETNRSLSELRQYVNSPICRQWQMMSRLNNPMRFAGFANGEPHLMEEEILNYDNQAMNESDSSDNGNANYLPVRRELVRSQQQVELSESEEEVMEDEDLDNDVDSENNIDNNEDEDEDEDENVNNNEHIRN